jgi:hypothetical protein
MNKLIRSVLKTVIYFLDQTDHAADTMRDRVSDATDTMRHRVSNAAGRVSDLHDRAVEIYEGPSTSRNVLMFAAGVGLGIGAGLLLAPASGEEIRGQIGEKVQNIGERVKDRFSSGKVTGTEGM